MATKKNVKNKKKDPSPALKSNKKRIKGDGAMPPIPGEKADLPRKSDGKDAFPVVGIGASAGGLEAYERFFANMPPDSGMAFVLIPHLDPTHKSIMPELLQRHTKMNVVQAEEGMEVGQNRIYIIPPNRDLSIMNGKLVLLEPTVSRAIRHPVDYFFRSLAQDRGENAVAIILSGTGSEGTLGLKAVKGEGGLVIVQDPREAKYDGMPASAVATGLVDYVVPASRMPEILLKYKYNYNHNIQKAAALPEKPAGKAPDPLQRIFSLIRTRTGHDFTQYKPSTILRRVQRRMAIHQIPDLPEYVNYLRNNPDEIVVLFREMLIRVTNFFRDREAFEVLKDKVLPLITDAKSYDKPFRVWVPGCSTGEEAYSLAIILHEYSQKVKADYKVHIFATDIDSGAIEIARAGVYPDTISVDVPSERLERYFVKKDNTYKIRDEIREMMVFSVQNVIKDPPFSKLDLVSCRNLLIYLGPALQKKVLPLFHYALNPGGALFLGTSESLGDATDLFDTIDRKWKLFRARKIEALLPVVMSPRQSGLREGEVKQTGNAGVKSREPLRINEFTEKLLLDRYSPPAVIVNEKGDILYIHGRTGKYLEPASGKAALNVIEMAREGLRLELRNALRKAAAGRKNLKVEQVEVRSNGGFEMIDLEVNYLFAPEQLEGLIMVVFRQAPPVTPKKGTPSRGRIGTKIQEHIRELEFELKSTRTHLQTTIEELETSNEELKSTNEELQSSNEELQSTNEEIETSKEELQSVNEELMTVNAELQNKIEDLAQVNNDMANLVASTRIPTVFLDMQLRIKSFTPETVNVFSVRETDIGRPISDITSKVDYPEFLDDIREVLRTLMIKERTVHHHDNRWYICRILPYRTLTNMIDGTVITFINVTDLKRAEERVQTGLAYHGIVDTIREPLLVLNAEFKVISANRSFYRAFRAAPAETEGCLIYDLGNGQWNIPKLKELLEKILPQNAEFSDYEVEHDFPSIGRRKMVLNARRIFLEGTTTETILLAIEDRTGK